MKPSNLFFVEKTNIIINFTILMSIIPVRGGVVEIILKSHKNKKKL